MDKARCHRTKEVVAEIEKLNTTIELIPEGLTMFLQPLDISTNRWIKNKFAQEYASYLINNDTKRVNRETFIDWICEIWDKMDGDILTKSFRHCGYEF